MWLDQDKNSPEFHLNIYYCQYLRNQCKIWIPHNSGWQHKIENAIFDYTGIAPIN
jgi:hypothetical protein